MKRLLVLLTMVFVGSLIGSAVLAADGEGKQARKGPRGGDPEARFAKVDTDGDGKVSLSEFKVMHEKRMERMKERMGDREPPEGREPPDVEEIFKKLDTDEDGYLSKEELREGAKMRRGRRGPPGGGDGGGPRGPRGGGGGGDA